MVAIEVNGVRVEASTEKEAKRAMARLVRESRKAEEAKGKLRKMAQLRSESIGYRVLGRMAEKGELPKAWEYFPRGAQYAPFQTDLDGRETVIDGEECKATIEHYGMEFLGGVCNGAGFCFVVAMRDTYTNQTVCYAVGTEQGEYCLSLLHGITPEHFKHRKA